MIGGDESMAHSNENFKEWISCIPDKMDKFTHEFAGNNHLILDYTLASLNDLERWIIAHYHDGNELTNDSSTLDYITIYIGETFRRYLGGEWDIDIDNKEDAHHPIITLADASYKGETQFSPMALATDCVGADKGNYLSGILFGHISSKIKTVDKLVEFMEKECYNFDSFSIGKYRALEGLFLDRDGSGFIYGYEERGHRDIIKHFDNEEAAVSYVLEQISKGEVDDSHLAAFTMDEEEILEAEKKLKEMFISFWRNDVPGYSLDGKTAYRIFVFGKNIRYIKGLEGFGV